MKRRTLMSWSSGKDSAWALLKLMQDPEIDLVGLFCTVNKEFKRVAMHSVRVELLQEQAKNIGLPLEIIEIPYPCSNDEYEYIMSQFTKRAKNDNIENFAFGDLFLKDVRNYREEKLKGTGINPIFPIWGTPTDKLSREIIDSGLRAVITCINPKQIDKEFIGREFDKSFLDSLPENIDPCGENGEFHSFDFDAPMFKEEIKIIVGDIVHRDDFIFADILPESSNKSFKIL
jgi:uncharacterized protein (TIGR00290 family)